MGDGDRFIDAEAQIKTANEFKLGVPSKPEPPVHRLHDLLMILAQMEHAERRAAVAYILEFYELKS